VAENPSIMQAETGTMGKIVIKLPMPPGFMLSIFNNDDRYLSAYMKEVPGYYDTGDAGLIDSDGYVSVMTRTDDVINVAGHRLSTGALEEVSE
jgi:propionyl-CoA synthetase